MKSGPRLVALEPLEARRFLSAHRHHHRVPRFDHIVIVVEENKDYGDVLGTSTVPPSLWPVIPPRSSDASPYLHWLGQHGANMTKAHSLTHPSQPNYLAMFSGSTQGIVNDEPPKEPFGAPSLAGQLLAAGLSFTSYSEGLPSAGSTIDKHGRYARKHNPASDFADVPPEDNQPFSAFPSDFTKLPTVSMVIPNQSHDMHSGSIHAGDHWLRSHLSAYARWAKSHRSLLVVMFDEGRNGNHIPMIFYGQGVKRKQSEQAVNHYSLLRTIEEAYHVEPLGGASDASPIRTIFSEQPFA
jgi:hypothetical protein